MNPPSLLSRRRSTPSRLLGDPGPDRETLRAMLAEAVRVPDHGKLVPWRLLLIRGEQRHQLGELLVRRQQQLDPNAPAALLDKDRQRFSQAPVVVAVVARIEPGHRIPEREQLLSAGCVCFSLLLAAQERGFGAQWLTGWAAYDESIGAALGLSAGESIAGFIHIGSVDGDPVPERARPELDAVLGEWPGPA